MMVREIISLIHWPYLLILPVNFVCGLLTMIKMTTWIFSSLAEYNHGIIQKRFQVLFTGTILKMAILNLPMLPIPPQRIYWISGWYATLFLLISTMTAGMI